MVRSRLRILQVHSALYVPHLLARGLREIGYNSDVLSYDFEGPARDLWWDCDFTLPSTARALPRQLAFFAGALTRYDVFHFWGSPYLVPPLYNLFARHLPWDLALIKKLNKRIVFQSDGCFPMIRPSVWKTKIDPLICHVCQTTQGDIYGACSNKNTIRINTAMNQYADLRIGMGMGYDFEADAVFEFMPVDTTHWTPDLAIPAQYVYHRQHPDSVVVFHSVGSHVIGNRGNIKGTVWIHETIDDLRAAGYNVELMHVERVPNRVMRYYQSQADIVVDQLLLGGGGANARESLAVGKPVMTRVHPEQWDAFRRGSAPHPPPPFVDTVRETLRENLVRLIENAALRRDLGRRSAAFARDVLSPSASARRYARRYEALFSPKHLDVENPRKTDGSTATERNQNSDIDRVISG